MIRDDKDSIIDEIASLQDRMKRLKLSDTKSLKIKTKAIIVRQAESLRDPIGQKDERSVLSNVSNKFYARYLSHLPEHQKSSMKYSKTN